MQGQDLRNLRMSAGMKSYELADAIGISRATMSRYERDRAPIPRLVELASRYICVPTLVPTSAEERLIEAIKEVARQ